MHNLTIRPPDLQRGRRHTAERAQRLGVSEKGIGHALRRMNITYKKTDQFALGRYSHLKLQSSSGDHVTASVGSDQNRHLLKGQSPLGGGAAALAGLAIRHFDTRLALFAFSQALEPL